MREFFRIIDEQADHVRGRRPAGCRAHRLGHALGIRLLLLTGCRLSEIQFLRWDYVKKDCIELPDSKTGGRVVPLGPEARAVLAGLRRQDDNPWVLAGKVPGSHITDLQKPWRRIRRRAGLEDVRIHDLRHTCASSPYRLIA